MRYSPFSRYILDRIPHFIVSITDRCNLNCPYCFNKDMRKELHEFSYEDLVGVYEKYQPDTIQFFGGEPTLRWDDIIKFMNYAFPKMEERGALKNSKCFNGMAMISNGTVKVDYTDVPAQYRKNTLIVFSLDGMKEFHELGRGKGNWEKTVDSIKRCAETGIYTGISCTRTAKNYLNSPDDLQEFVDFCGTLNIHSLMFNVAFWGNRPQTRGMAFSADYTAARRRIKALKYDESFFHFVADNSHLCPEVAIHIHSNGEISPKCCAIVPTFGHWRDWSPEDLTKLLNYCHHEVFDCKSAEWSNIDRYAKGLLMAAKSGQTEGGES